MAAENMVGEEKGAKYSETTNDDILYKMKT